MTALDQQIRPARGSMLSENALGRVVSMGRSREWRHPWWTRLEWLPMSKRWVAFVKAGFVNGLAPIVRTTAGVLREARGTFYGQLVDARTGAAEIAQLARLATEEAGGLEDGATVEVPLYENPPITLSEWRNIGWDGSVAAPLYFQYRGVNKPSGAVSGNLDTGIKISRDKLFPPKGNRLLRACDILLHQPRTALTSQIDITPGGAITGSSIVTQTLGLREASTNDRLKIQTGTYSAIEQSKLNFSGASSLLADYEEKTWDEILVSTVYLMSPPDAPLDAQPDSTWQAFAKHNTFWNLSWSQPEVTPFFSNDIFAPLLGLLGVIGGGSGFLWASYVTASINDATQGAYNILAAKSLAGSFWTPTSGGTTSAMPDQASASASTGLDKAAAARAKAAAEAAKKLNVRLDPAFPYEGQKFNTSLLSK